MIKTTENISHLLKPAAYLNGALISLFFHNWQGQKIIDSSGTVYESAYVLHKISNSVFAKSRIISLYKNITK